eukprot:3995280-Prymnesium_polylepis.1
MLLHWLLDAPTDGITTLLDAVLDTNVALLTVARSCQQLRQALEPSLRAAERRSAEVICEYYEATLEELAAAEDLELDDYLPVAQCRHLGTWLRHGGPLGRVAVLWWWDDDGEEAYREKELNLEGIRTSGELKLTNTGSQHPAAVILTLYHMTISTAVRLDLSYNSIGGEAARALTSSLSTVLEVNAAAVLTELVLWGNNIGDQGATAIANALQVNK